MVDYGVECPDVFVFLRTGNGIGIGYWFSAPELKYLARNQPGISLAHSHRERGVCVSVVCV